MIRAKSHARRSEKRGARDEKCAFEVCLTGGEAPEADSVVPACRGQRGAVGRKSEGGHFASVLV